ncbi:hypothetical protein HDU97_000798 [Phlyctochytrium planicorne]|nr:hypothetical protein HDU97_000798 [Phlyctochytrium planicorne]
MAERGGRPYNHHHPTVLGPAHTPTSSSASAAAVPPSPSAHPIPQSASSSLPAAALNAYQLQYQQQQQQILLLQQQQLLQMAQNGSLAPHSPPMPIMGSIHQMGGSNSPNLNLQHHQPSHPYPQDSPLYRPASNAFIPPFNGYPSQPSPAPSSTSSPTSSPRLPRPHTANSPRPMLANGGLVGTGDASYSSPALNRHVSSKQIPQRVVSMADWNRNDGSMVQPQAGSVSATQYLQQASQSLMYSQSPSPLPSPRSLIRDSSPALQSASNPSFSGSWDRSNRQDSGYQDTRSPHPSSRNSFSYEGDQTLGYPEPLQSSEPQGPPSAGSWAPDDDLAYQDEGSPVRPERNSSNGAGATLERIRSMYRSESREDNLDGETLAGGASTLRTLAENDLPEPAHEPSLGHAHGQTRRPPEAVITNLEQQPSYRPIPRYPAVDPSLVGSSSTINSYQRSVYNAAHAKNDSTARWVEHIVANASPSIPPSQASGTMPGTVSVSSTLGFPVSGSSGRPSPSITISESWRRVNSGGARSPRALSSSGTPTTPSTGSVIPPRAASIQRSIETLLDEGAAAFASGLHDDAVSRWTKARECAIVERNLFLEAKALSNLAVSLRVRGRVTEAINLLWEAWTATEELVVDSLENEMVAGEATSPTSPTTPTEAAAASNAGAMRTKNPWLELILKQVPMLRANPNPNATSSASLPHRRRNEGQEETTFSDIPSNRHRTETTTSASTTTTLYEAGGRSRAYGSLGRSETTLGRDTEEQSGGGNGRSGTPDLSRSQSSRGSWSGGIGMGGPHNAVSALDQSRRLSLNFGRSSTLNALLHLGQREREPAPTPAPAPAAPLTPGQIQQKQILKMRRESVSKNDPLWGPPIVVWLLDLTTNIGNVHYAAGEAKEAERWHAACLALAEATLERFPIIKAPEKPAPSVTFANSSPASPLSPRRTKKLKSPQTQLADLQNVKLSYLHRSCLLAKSRSLTHLALCHPGTLHRNGEDGKKPSHSAAAAIASLLASNARDRESSNGGVIRATNANVASRTDVYRSIQASVAANAAVAWTLCAHAQALPLNAGAGKEESGDGKKGGTTVGFHRALERLETAGRLFRSAGDELGVSRVEATLGAICVEVGRCIDGARWVRRFVEKEDRNGKGREERVGKAGREGGPGRIWIEKGVKLLHIHVESLRGARDWWGMTATLANLGIAYTLLNQPHLALHFLSRVLDAADPSPSNMSSASGSSSRSPLPPPPTPIPPLLLQGVRVALWHALAALASTGSPPWYPAPETTGLPAPPTADPVNALIRFVTGNDRADVVHLTLKGLDDLLLRPFRDRRMIRSMMWTSSARLSVDDVGYRLRMIRRSLDLDLLPSAATIQNATAGTSGENAGAAGASAPAVPAPPVSEPISAILAIEVAADGTHRGDEPVLIPAESKVRYSSPALLCLAAEELGRALRKEETATLDKAKGVLERVLEAGGSPGRVLASAPFVGPHRLARAAGTVWAQRLGVCAECCHAVGNVGGAVASIGTSSKVVYVGPKSHNASSSSASSTSSASSPTGAATEERGMTASKPMTASPTSPTTPMTLPPALPPKDPQPTSSSAVSSALVSSSAGGSSGGANASNGGGFGAAGGSANAQVVAVSGGPVSVPTAKFPCSHMVWRGVEFV